MNIILVAALAVAPVLGDNEEALGHVAASDERRWKVQNIGQTVSMVVPVENFGSWCTEITMGDCDLFIDNLLQHGYQEGSCADAGVAVPCDAYSTTGQTACSLTAARYDYEILSYVDNELLCQDQGVKPPQEISDYGYGDNNCPRGWYDVQGQGVANDYCRWVGMCGCRGSCSFWSCALAGSTEAYSKSGTYLEGGHPGPYAMGESVPVPGSITVTPTPSTVPCSSNEDCEDYCNFDDEESGFCEFCANVHHGCANDGFDTYRGERACMEVCEGEQSLGCPISSYRCKMQCPHGFVKDANGCTVCMCARPEGSVAMHAAPESEVPLAVTVFAAFGFVVTVYGAFKHFTK